MKNHTHLELYEKFARHVGLCGLSVSFENKTKAPKTRGFRGFLRSALKCAKHIIGGNGGIRTLDEALHPILP